MITLYQLNIVIGSFLISIVNNFTQKIKSDASYRIPIGLLLILPVLIAPGLPFLPESPRMSSSSPPQESKLGSNRVLWL